jgi:hypothetical protein
LKADEPTFLMISLTFLTLLNVYLISKINQGNIESCFCKIIDRIRFMLQFVN